MLRKIHLLSSCVGAILAAAPATAQNAETPAAEPASLIEDIVVTAQRREQALTDVGLTINALSGDALSQLGISTSSDLSRVVPALNVVPAGTGVSGAPVYTMRGIGFNSRSLSAPSAVSIYVDETPLSYSYMSAGPLLDLQRVEVLKGPQGTLYGQNATGGAINYIAARPTSTFAMGIEGTYGRFNEIDVNGFVSGPITETLRARISARVITRDGYLKSITQRGVRFGDQDKQAARLLIDWDPSDTVRFKFSLNGWRDTSDTLPFQVVGLNPSDPLGGALGMPGTLFPCFDGIIIGCPAKGGARYSIRDQLIAFATLHPDSNRRVDRTPGRPYGNDNDFIQTALRGDWEVLPDITLSSLSSYSRFRLDANRDLDSTPFDISEFKSDGGIRSFNQELRLTGRSSDQLTWIVGGNFSKDKFREDNENPAAGTSLGEALGINNTLTFSRSKRQTWAVFANADYEITPQLTFTGGVRYTEVKLNYRGCSRDPGDGSLARVFAGTAGPGDCITFLDVSSTPPNQGVVALGFKEHNTAWRAGLNWKPDSDLLVYGNVSRGYKSGDIPSITALVESQLQPVRQEKVTAYEAGVKASMFGKRLQASAAVFYYDYLDKHLQTNILTFLGLAEATVNVPKAKVKGAELEVAWRSAHGLNLRGAVGYTDTKIGPFVTFASNPSPTWPPAPGYNSSPVVDATGEPFNLAPKWQANFDAQYDWTLREGLDAFVGGSASHASSTLPTLVAAEPLRMRAYTTFDLRAGIEDPDGRWRASVWGRNVTNTKYAVSGLLAFETSGLYLGMPTTYGLTLSYKYK